MSGFIFNRLPPTVRGGMGCYHWDVPIPHGGGGNTGSYDFPAWITALPTMSNGLPWNPGIPGGIPTGTLDTTLTPAQMNTTDINAAIQDASTRGSPTNIRVVKLPSGTYSGVDGIDGANYVIVRGNGPTGSAQTRISFLDTGGFRTAFQDWGGLPITTMSLSVSGNLPIGSTNIVVSSTTGFAVGDIIQLDQLDDLSYVAILDAGYHKRAPYADLAHGPRSTDGFRSITSLHLLTAISGTTFTIDPPTRIRFDQVMNPQVWRVTRRDTDGTWYFGIEDLSLNGPQGGAIINRIGAYNWIRNVETAGSGSQGINEGHVGWSHQFRSEIRRMYAHDTTSGSIQGGNNYGINIDDSSSECLVIDSISVRMNKLIQTNNCGPGNVIAYCYADDTAANADQSWMDGAVNGSHQSFSHNLLVEGCWAANVGCDTTHGNSGLMVFLRNYTQGHSTNFANSTNMRCANSDAWQREMAFIGNVFNAPSGAVYEVTSSTQPGYKIWSIGQNEWGSGDNYDGLNTNPPQNNMMYGGTQWDNRQATFTSKAKDMLFRHGNWDSVNQSIIDWSGSFPNHSIAPSLFLTGTPDFFSGSTWPWVNPTGSTWATRTGSLPAKARFDAGTPI